MDRDRDRHLIQGGFERLAVNQWTERDDHEQLPHEVSLDHFPQSAWLQVLQLMQALMRRDGLSDAVR